MIKFYVAAPFGNYIHRRRTTPVIGTFTLKRRTGLISQLIKTLRYSFRDKCWYNRLGLRNPGIRKGLQRYDDLAYKSPVLSIAAIEPEDWSLLYSIIPLHVRLELNISCPNIDHMENYTKGIEQFVNHNPIIKLSPHMQLKHIHDFYDMGFRKFHSCNTFLTNKGARSGEYLRPYAMKQIRYIKTIDKNNFCIAGGGIQNMVDVYEYSASGADAFSLGTVCFNLYKLNKLLLHNE